MNPRGTDQNYYQILEISPSAPHHEVVAAYQKAKEAYSPNSPALYTMFTKEEAEEIRNMIEEAFRILSNPAKRKEYDSLLVGRSIQPSPSSSDLPDFAPAVETVSVVSNSRPARQTGVVPDGFAKSRLSVYEVKAEVDQEIANQKEFDGAFLRKVRQYKNINLDQLSKETRISRSYLTALESDEFTALPAPVFLRGFVIQVARMLGLDENLVANSYMARVKKEN